MQKSNSLHIFHYHRVQKIEKYEDFIDNHKLRITLQLFII